MPTFSLESIEVGSQLYLTAAPGIEIGTCLSGGHFRDTVEQGIVTDHSSILEIAWELVRMREFPSRPCRFDALFLWPDEVRARAWHYRQGIFESETSSQRGLYQVEVERICRIWAADMNLISYIRDSRVFVFFNKLLLNHFIHLISFFGGESPIGVKSQGDLLGYITRPLVSFTISLVDCRQVDP